MNAFLFAEVGVEESGQRLSVFSTLARLGLDPWQEAGRLDRLPHAAAVDGLARIIAAMPAGRWMPKDATDIATRLVALLPGGGGSVAPRKPGVPSTRSNLHAWTVVLVLLATLLSGLALDHLADRNASGRPTAASRSASRGSAPAGPR